MAAPDAALAGLVIVSVDTVAVTTSGKIRLMDSPGLFADLAAQRACWHPVAFGSALGDRPRAAGLLGEPLVVWLHLRFDAVAVAYRKAMRDLGLAAIVSIGIASE